MTNVGFSVKKEAQSLLDELRRDDSCEASPEDLLRAIVGNKVLGSDAFNCLLFLEVDMRSLREALVPVVRTKKTQRTDGRRFRRVLERAAEYAEQDCKPAISSAHLLLAIRTAGGGDAALALTDAGLTEGRLKGAVNIVLNWRARR